MVCIELRLKKRGIGGARFSFRIRTRISTFPFHFFHICQSKFQTPHFFLIPGKTTNSHGRQARVVPVQLRREAREAPFDGPRPVGPRPGGGVRRGVSAVRPSPLLPLPTASAAAIRAPAVGGEGGERGARGVADGKVRSQKDRLLRQDGLGSHAHLPPHLLPRAFQRPQPLLRLGHPHRRRRLRVQHR